MNTFGQWLWLLIWWFLFFAYLVIFFQILSDLFRDKSLGGWAKAGWIIALVFVPFLSALIYIIARGDGMGRRHAEALGQAKAQTDAYIRQTASTSSPAADIAAAKSLHDSGAIDDAEFAALKAKALA
ncbi:SHOCT domain-containing protein [Cellulomonas sp. P5_E12]